MRIEIENLSKKFGKKVIFDQLELKIEKADIWALIAPNGAGKTTLMDCIANLQEPDSGTIRLLGRSNQETDLYRDVAYLQDNRVLYPELTGREHLSFVQKVQGLERERIQQVIEEIGIADYVDAPVKSYSLGMKQHLLLALAIMNQPKILLLDEPLNGLDPASYIQTRKLLTRLAASGTTIIISSHQLNEVDLLTSQLLFLKEGKIIQQELDSQQVRYAIRTSDNLALMEKLAGQEGLELAPDKEQILLSRQIYPLHDLLQAVLDMGLEILDIDRLAGQSEEVYQSLFERKAGG